MRTTFIVFCLVSLVGISANAQPPNDWGWPPSHTTAVSRFWPSDHSSNPSKYAPPNHIYTISKTWIEGPIGPVVGAPATPGVHNLSYSFIHQWPPNHIFDVSISWHSSGAVVTHYRVMEEPFDLQIHDRALSQQWRHATNHVYSVSGTWPGPDSHDGTISILWTPNHRTQLSLTSMPPRPEDHVQLISDSLTVPPVHNATVSDFWPPNHHREMSKTFPTPHARGTSASWPPGHHGVISTSWPPGAPWPPSHVRSVSDEWGAPLDPDWPLFPPDHSWFTTATAIAGLGGGGGGNSNQGGGN